MISEIVIDQLGIKIMAKLQLVGRRKLNAQNVEGILIEDLSFLLRVINQNHPIERCAAEELAESLKKAYEIHEKLDTTSQKELQESLRLFIFLVWRHKDKVVIMPTSSSYEDPLDEVMESISDKIGVISTRFSPPELPETKFLPKEFAATKESWKAIRCPHPNRRATSIPNGKIDFIKRDSKASVRLQLEQEAKEQEDSSLTTSIITGGSEDFYLNLMDLNYYKLGLMHADHLLPSESMLKRLQEVVTALNYDPTFKKELQDSGDFAEYFIEEKKEGKTTIIGNYWFYMAHHNSMENLWFLLASDNSAGGKLATDPIEWLQTREIGKIYLNSLAQEGKYIDKSYPLYKVSDGQPLKDSFIMFAKEHWKQIIKVYKELALLHSTLRYTVASTDSSHPTTKIRSSSTRRAGFYVVQNSLVKDIADDTSDSSVGSDKKRKLEFDKEFTNALAEDEQFKASQQDLFQTAHDVSRRVKQRLFGGEPSSLSQSEKKDEHDDGYDSTFSNNL